MLDVFRELAVEAGAAIMKVRGADLGAEAKADDSPVTLADLAADKVIRAGLTAHFPEIPAVTEEQADSHDVAAAGARFFLVDPLDGTKEFIKGGTDFTVNIALIENGEPVRGVVYAPAQGRIWIGDRASGAREEALDGSAKDIRVTACGESALRCVASKSHRDQATDDYINKYDIAEFKSAGSSLKFCLLASGEADLYPRLGRTMEWDTAAGHAVLTAAGGRVVRFDDPEQPLRYGKPGFENPFFIACADGVALIA